MHTFNPSSKEAEAEVEAEVEAEAEAEAEGSLKAYCFAFPVIMKSNPLKL